MARTHAATPRVPQGPQDLLDMGDPLKIVKTTMAHMPLAYNDDSPNVERFEKLSLTCFAFQKSQYLMAQRLKATTANGSQGSCNEDLVGFFADSERSCRVQRSRRRLSL